MGNMSERAIRYEQRRKQRRQRRIFRAALGVVLVLGAIFWALHVINSRSNPGGSSMPVDTASIQF
jgi:hypothetical protein